MVRQYGQFISLMENWADFQKNLTTAYQSEGALSKQADIYAESWKAARERVRAASEDIYDSLINPDFYIGLDNVLTPILEQVATLIDSFGGLSGILAIVSRIMNQIYGDKIAQSMRDMVANIKQISTSDTARASALKTQASIISKAYAREAIAYQYVDNIESNRLLTYSKLIDLQDRATVISKDYTTYQQEQLSNELKNLTVLQQEIQTLRERKTISTNTLEELEEDLYNKRKTQKVWKSGSWGQLVGQIKTEYNADVNNQVRKSSNNQFFNQILNSKSLQSISSTQDKIDQIFKTAIEGYKNSVTQLQKFRDISNAVSKDLIQDAVEIAQSTQAFGEGLSDNKIRSFFQIEEGEDVSELARRIREATEELNRYKAILLGLGSSGTEKILDKMRGPLISQSVENEALLKYIEELNKEIDQLNDKIERGQFAQKDWADTFVEVGNTISETEMALYGFNSALDALSNTDLSMLDRTTMLLGSIGQLLPSLAKGIGTIKALLTGTQTIVSLGVSGWLSIIPIIAIVIAGIAKAYDFFNESADEAREKVDQLNQEYESTKQKLESLNSELQTTQSRIEELQSKGPLTLVEQEELARLREQNVLLERNKQLQEAQAKQQAIENFDTQLSGFEKRYNDLLYSIPKEPTWSPDFFGAFSNWNEAAYSNIDEWFAEESKKLDENSYAFKELSILYENYANEINKSREEYQDTLSQYMGNTQESYEQLEQEYANLIEWVDKGWISEDRSEIYKKQLQEALEISRRARSQEDYTKIYITPAIDSTALSQVKSQLYSLTNYSNKSDVDILKSLGLSDKQIESTISMLDTLGISLQSVIDRVQESVAKAREGLSGILGDSTDAYINTLSAEQLAQIASLDWSNLDDPIDSLREMYHQLALINGQTTDWISNIEQAKAAASSALETLQSGDRLDAEAITNLQQLFNGLYDLSNLDYISTYEQALQIGEAFRSLTDIGPRIQVVQDSIAQYRDRLEEVRGGYDDLEGALRQATSNIQNNEDSIENAEDGAKNLERTIADLSARLAEEEQLKIDISDAEAQLQKLKDFEIDPIEVEIANIESVKAQMAQISKAASLIGEDFKVAVKDVEELSLTMPELLHDAVVDMETGIVQLNQEVVNSVAEGARASVNAQAQSLGEALQKRIDTTREELNLINTVRDAAIGGSQDAVKAISEDADDEQTKKETVAKAIMIAKIQQAITEQAQSAQTSQNEIEWADQVVNASKQQTFNLAKNYETSFKAIDEMGKAVYSNLVDYMNAQARGETPNGSRGIAVGFNASGLLSGTGSKLDVYNTTDVTGSFRAALDWVNGNTQGLNAAYRDYLSDLRRNGESIGATPFADFSKIVSGAITKSFGGIEIVKPEDIKNSPDWVEIYNTLQARPPEEFLGYLDSAASYMAKLEADDISKLSGLQGAQAVADQLKNAGIKEDKGGSKGSTKKPSYYTDEEEKKLEDILERYHEITREIEDQSSLLEDIQNDTERTYGASKLKNYKKELEALTKQQDNYNKELQEAQGYFAQDKQKLIDIFGEGNIQFNENDEIANYTELLRKTIDDYNNGFLADYNAFMKRYTETNDESLKESLEAEKHAWDERKKIADEQFSDRQEALKQYEATVDKIQEVNDNLEEVARNIADNRLQQIEYRLEVVLDVKSMKDALREFDIKAAEMFNDALTHGIPVADIRQQQAQAEANMFAEYQDQYNKLVAEYESADKAVDRDRIIKDIEELQGKVLDSAEAILDWINSIEDLVPAAVDAAATRFKVFTDQLEHNTTVLDTIKELYALQGVTYKTMEGFNRLQANSQEKLEAQVANAQLNKKWYDEALIRLQQAQADLDSLGGDETDLRYDTYKKARDAYLQEFNEAQKAYLSLAQQAMETAQAMYMEQIDKAVYDFGQKVSGGLGLDLLQDKYDHYIEKDDRYFDKVNEAYETTAWYLKLQDDIDKATNQQTKDRLQALQKEIDLRREGGKLSQYDLDILNAKYDVLQAQMALEDAQNAKNKLQLVRDRQGNWNYQYTSDPEEIANKEKDLIEAQNEWYNIAKDQVKEVTGEIISTWQECQDKIKEVYQDMTLTDQERADRAAEIYNYYTDKIKYLEEEKQVAIKDMTDAGNESIMTDAILMGDKLTDLTGLTSEDIKKIVEDSGNSIIDLISKDNEQLKNLVASNTGLIDLFDNTFAKDLDNMTNNTMQFEDTLRDTLGNAEADFRNYGDVVNQVALDTGTTLDDLSQTTEQVSDSTDRLRDAGLEAADSLWNMVDATYQAAQGYLDMASSLWEAVEALRALGQEQMEYVQSKVDLDNSEWNANKEFRPDYTNDIVNAFKQSGVINAEIEQLFAERAEKMSVYGQGDNISNESLRNILNSASNGHPYANQLVSQMISGDMYGLSEMERLWKMYKNNPALAPLGLDTGGYTGEFAGEKLAYLHEKELVLNKTDTANILAAVGAVRSMDNVFASIERALDSSVTSIMSLLGQKMSVPAFTATQEPLEQRVVFEHVEFPNVTSHTEIEEAFNNLVNDASQYARRRTE